MGAICAQLDQVNALVREAIACGADAAMVGRPLAQAHGPALLREAWLAGSLAPTSPPPAARRRRIDWAVLQQWAAQQWHNNLTVADLAMQVHLSPSQFAARCQGDQGMGAMAWLRSQGI